jgi:hypothetical protein
MLTFQVGMKQGVVYFERPIEPNLGPSLADVLLYKRLKVLMQGFLNFL